MANFRKLAENLGRLSTVPSRASRLACNGINVLIQGQFRTSTDPYGKAWAPLRPYTVRVKGHDTILVDTGRMMAETVAVPRGGAGIELRTVPYAGYHQTGTRSMVAREPLPDRSDLPRTWQRVIQTAIDSAYDEARK